MSGGRIGVYLALAAIGVGWGGSVVASKFAVSTGHDPLGLVFWQSVVASAALGAILLFGPRSFGGVTVFRARNLSFFVGLSLVGTVLPSALFFFIASRLPAGVLPILIAMVPMFALAIALPLRLEAPSFRRAAGVVLGAVSIVMIIGPEAGLPDPATAPLVLLGLLIPLLYGGEAIFVSLRMPVDLHPVGAVFGASVAGIVLLAPLNLIEGVWIDPIRPWGVVEWSLVVVALLQAACYSGYVSIVGLAGPVFASLVAYLVTISGVAWGLILLDEAHSSWFWAALAVMLAGMTLVQPKRPVADLV